MEMILAALAIVVFSLVYAYRLEHRRPRKEHHAH